MSSSYHVVDYKFQGNRIGNQIGKLVVEFIKSHINPDPAAASVPLSSQILSTQGFSPGFNRSPPAQSFGGETPRQRNPGFMRSPPAQSFGETPRQRPQQGFNRSPPTPSRQRTPQPFRESPSPQPLRELPRRLPGVAAPGFVTGHPGTHIQLHMKIYQKS